MEYLEDRITQLEKTVGAQENILQQVKTLEQQVEGMLVKHNAQNLDFSALKGILTTAQPPLIGAPHGSPPQASQAPSREAKIKIIEARAAGILSQTANLGDMALPNLDFLELGDIETQVRQCVHDFDESTQQSIQFSRIYLENINQNPCK